MLRFFARSVSFLAPPAPRMGSEERVFVPRKEKIRGCADDLNVCGFRRRHRLFARERQPHRRRFVRRADWGTRIPACASGAVPPVTAMGECGCARPYLRPHTGKTPYSMIFFRRPQRVAVPERMIHAVVCARRRATGTVGHGCRIGGGRSRNRCMKRIARRRSAAGCGMPCTGHDRRGGGIRATISLCGSDKGPCG